MTEMISKKGNVLCISDLHIPYQHKKAFDHCRRVRDKYKCSVVVNLGDIVDNHSISYHEKEPDYACVGKELDEAYKELVRWKTEFPTVFCCFGNHDSLLKRKAKTHGLSGRMIKSLNEIYDLPKSWRFSDSWVKDDVRYCHGIEVGGKYGFVGMAEANMMSTVTGHLHASSGVHFISSPIKLIYGMGAGCLLDKDSFAMAYGKHFKRKPILGCSVVLNEGRLPIFEPLAL